MKIKSLILLVLIIFIVGCFSNVSSSKVIFCYYGSWASTRPGNGKFGVNDINPNLCTHITYTFIGLAANGHVKLLDTGALLPPFVNLKKVNPNVKLIVSMGGWNEGSEKYSKVLNSPTLRSTLVNSIYDFIVRYNFDGFDFDWEYPGLRGGLPSDKQAFVEFLQELRVRFSGSNLILTAAVGATKQHIQTSYDIKNMNNYLDLINIMSYDFHGAYDGVTGQTSPLYASSTDVNRELNQHAAIQAYLAAGANPSKLVMGVAFYGRTFTLASSSSNRIGAPSIGPGLAGPYTNEPGVLSYLEVCENFKNGNWFVIWDDEQKNPYAYSGNQWIGYDSVYSIRQKAQYAMNNNLAGVMVWSIESDDKNNVCGDGAYPLLTAINDVFPKNDVTVTTTTTTATTSTATTTTTATPTTTTTTTTPPIIPMTTTTIIINNPPVVIQPTAAPPPPIPPPSQPNNSPINCNYNLIDRDPYNWAIYYTCIRSDNGWITHKHVCPSGLLFDLKYKMCLFAAQVY